jgi:hypothetical protein
MRLLTTALVAIAVLSGSFLCQNQLCAQGQFKSKENLDLPYDAFGLNETEEEAPEVVVFYGQSFEGDGIFYCLDRSSSTCGGEIAIEKRETIRNIMEFSSRVEFGIAFYDRGLRKFPSSGRPITADAGGKSAAVSFVSSTQCGGGTCVKLGLMACLDFASFSSAKRNVIIYLGDGGTTCPGADPSAYAQTTLAEVKSKNFKNAQINSIHVGTDPPGFSKQLASQNGGTFNQITR